MTEQYWEGSICGRVTKIDYHYDVYRITQLIRMFIQSHMDGSGHTPFGSNRFEEELESYIFPTFPMIKVTAVYGKNYFGLTIDYDDINYRVDVTNKVYDILRGAHNGKTRR